MTAALLVLAGGMALYGLALRPRGWWWLPVANGLTALAVAAIPLGGDLDTAHGVAAGAGYVTLAAIPVVVGRRPPSIAVGVAAGLCLLASVLVTYDGLFQRLGLTVAHLWVMVSALALLRSPSWSSTTPPAPAPADPPP